MNVLQGALYRNTSGGVILIGSGTAQVQADSSFATLVGPGGLCRMKVGTTAAVTGGAFTVDNNHVQLASLATGGTDNTASGSFYVRATSAGELHSSTGAPSSRTVKDNIAALEIDPAVVLSLAPRTYTYKDDPSTPRTGFIAEEAAEAGLDRWVTYEDRDNPEQPTGFLYEDFVAAHQIVLQQHRDEIAALRDEVAALRAQVRA